MTAASDTTLQKRSLRRRLRSDRDALSAAHRADCAKHALQHLITWQRWAAATLVASYLPHESEFDPTLLTRAARDRGAETVCPRVHGKSMSFHHWHIGDGMEETIGGVLQPLPAAPAVDAAAIDLFLTPLLGCGDSGMRLGYGGGFYDRLFSGVGGFRLGVGFAMQRVSDWESEAHDQRLDGFLSEEGLILFE
jgi:5-formyltetrahydrofolate cyclo-ligase